MQHVRDHFCNFAVSTHLEQKKKKILKSLMDFLLRVFDLVQHKHVCVRLAFGGVVLKAITRWRSRLKQCAAVEPCEEGNTGLVSSVPFCGK